MSFRKKVHKAIKRVPVLKNWLEQRAKKRYILQRIQRYPQLDWQVAPPCPQHRVEAARMQVGSKLFVFGGYITLESVCQRVDCFDLETHQWEEVATLPLDAAQTHNGCAYDGKHHIYLIGGQLGANCSPVTVNCFAFDTRNYQWSKLPPLPAGRYMPLVHYSKGRIHCLSGSMPDRSSCAKQHWSIAVTGDHATDSEWREDTPLSLPRTHTASHIIGDELLVFGGQTGDVPAIEGSPEFLCNFETPLEPVLDECYAFNLNSGKVRMLQSMPEKLSHSEHALLQIGSNIIIAGGVLDRMRMSDLIFNYDTTKDTWAEIGRLPYPMKSKIAAIHKGRLYIVTGQRSISEENLIPGEVLDEVWYANLPKSRNEE